MVSCLCVTGDRPAFMPWLLWNYQKQDYPFRELVIVDGSKSGVSTVDDPAIRIVRCSAETTIGERRNLALQHARGALVAWFDDDDWQHPQRLSLLADALTPAATVAGPTASWFVDLARLRARPYDGRRRPIFNGAVFRRAGVAHIAFNTDRIRATDTSWLTQVMSASTAPAILTPTMTSFWLSHELNISNPSRRMTFPHALRDVQHQLGDDFWGDTSSELIALQQRLPPVARTSGRPTASRVGLPFPAHLARSR